MKHSVSLILVVGLALLLTLLLQIGAGMSEAGAAVAAQQTGCQTFRETGKALCGSFMRYWSEHGGLMQQGFPITDQIQGAPEVNGKVYTVQYFERAVFELHPDMQPPHDILATPLGALEYSLRYPNGATNQKPNTSAGSIIFRESDKRLGGEFLTYWQQHGGADEQGNPISDEFQERSALDGKTYRVQYFERAVFELHPENAGTQYEVLLSQLGTFQLKRKHPGGGTSTPTAASTVVSASPSAVPNATMTPTSPADAETTLRQRPLNLPTVQPGQPCPTSAWRSIGQNLPPALGDGPIYAVGFAFDRDGMLHLRPEQLTDGLYYEKVMWASSADYDGLALVRGGQIDGPNEMSFQQYDGPVKADAWLDFRNSAGSPTGQPGWRGWPSYTVLRGPGCYAYQIDALPFTKKLVFRAVDTP